jgi:transposase
MGSTIVATNDAEFREALQRQPDVTVVVEACSPAGWVHDLAASIGLTVLVANTNAEAWAWKNVKRKTDRDDALKLAKLAAMDELPTVPMQPKPLRQRKSLIGLRKRFVGERIRGQNRIRGLLVGQGLAAPRGAKAWSSLGLDGLAQLARPRPDPAVEGRERPAAEGAVPAHVDRDPVQPHPSRVLRAACGSREAEDGGGGRMHAEAGDALLRRAEEPRPVRPQLRVKKTT